MKQPMCFFKVKQTELVLLTDFVDDVVGSGLLALRHLLKINYRLLKRIIPGWVMLSHLKNYS